MSPALTPRVWHMVVCDDAQPVEDEESVYHLWGARYHVLADSFPLFHQMQLYLVLSSTRQGVFPAHVRVMKTVDAWNEESFFDGELEPQPYFPEGGGYFTCIVPISVEFLEGGVYWVQILFGPNADSAHVKMEKPFIVNEREE